MDIRATLGDARAVLPVAAVTADRPRILLRRARLFARIHRPDQLIHAESYEVDLTVPRFEIVWDGQVVSAARAQLIATYLPARREWLWGFENASIAETGFASIRAAMASIDDLREALAARKFEIDPDAAYDLADWIALVTGAEAMYPAIVGEAVAFLALDFTEHRGQPAEGLTPWCLVCGHIGAELPHALIAGPEGRGLCQGCAANPVAILEDKLAERPDFLATTESEEPPDAPLADYVCALCTERRPRLMLPETALCWGCVDLVRRIFADK